MHGVKKKNIIYYEFKVFSNKCFESHLHINIEHLRHHLTVDHKKAFPEESLQFKTIEGRLIRFLFMQDLYIMFLWFLEFDVWLMETCNRNNINMLHKNQEKLKSLIPHFITVTAVEDFNYVKNKY